MDTSASAAAVNGAMERPILLTRKEAARVLGLSVRTLQLWATTGCARLPFVKVGRKTLYRRTDLERWASRLPSFLHTGEVVRRK